MTLISGAAANSTPSRYLVAFTITHGKEINPDNAPSVECETEDARKECEKSSLADKCQIGETLVEFA
jgi:hypothetical protein